MMMVYAHFFFHVLSQRDSATRIFSVHFFPSRNLFHAHFFFSFFNSSLYLLCCFSFGFNFFLLYIYIFHFIMYSFVHSSFIRLLMYLFFQRFSGGSGQHAVQGEENRVSTGGEVWRGAAGSDGGGRLQVLHLPVPWQHANEGQWVSSSVLLTVRNHCRCQMQMRYKGASLETVNYNCRRAYLSRPVLATIFGIFPSA